MERLVRPAAAWLSLGATLAALWAAIGLLVTCLRDKSQLQGPYLPGVVVSSVAALAVTVLCLLGASALRTQRRPGLALAAGVVAVLLSLPGLVTGLSLLSALVTMYRRASQDLSMYAEQYQAVPLLAAQVASLIGVAGVLLAGGIKTLAVMGKAEVRQAFHR